jgi:RHS repeat-associated protein
MKHDIPETDESADNAMIASVNDEADEPIIIDCCGLRLEHVVRSDSSAIAVSQSTYCQKRYTISGQELGAEPDMLYFRARYYDPVTRRWISEELMDFGVGTENLYPYCRFLKRDNFSKSQ